MANRTISIAPMMDWTDRHFRYFMRLISKHALLYTEMIHANAILQGAREKLLAYHESEHPIALQVGGCDPATLAQCAKIAEDFNYDEINLNVGCPSERVQSGRFGACLMAEPNLVADCIAAMIESCNIPVTVKTRLGIDHQDSYEEFFHIVSTIAATGCKTFIIHARKAWLKGLNPKENRTIPPLRYDWAKQLKRDLPALEIILNGGITSIEQIQQHLNEVDGVMIGREAYHNPYFLSSADQLFYEEKTEPLTRLEIACKMQEYISQQESHGILPKQVTRHILGLFHGLPGAKTWRRDLTEHNLR